MLHDLACINCAIIFQNHSILGSTTRLTRQRCRLARIGFVLLMFSILRYLVMECCGRLLRLGKRALNLAIDMIMSKSTDSLIARLNRSHFVDISWLAKLLQLQALSDDFVDSGRPTASHLAHHQAFFRWIEAGWLSSLFDFFIKLLFRWFWRWFPNVLENFQLHILVDATLAAMEWLLFHFCPCRASSTIEWIERVVCWVWLHHAYCLLMVAVLATT